MSQVAPLLLVTLFLVEIQCQQTFPYVSFMGETLANHCYVDLSLVGNDVSGSDSVQCHTDLNSCCSGAQGSHCGNWFFPNGTQLPFSGSGIAISQQRGAQRVDLCHPVVLHQTGIYHCDIQTDSMNETVYVGLYTSDKGKVHIVCKISRSESLL